jgi:hypothetical protein
MTERAVIGWQLQDCQMLYFQSKNPNLGKFWRALEWKWLVYSLAIWNIYYGHLVHLLAKW